MNTPSLYSESDDFHLHRRQQFIYPALYKRCRERQLKLIQVERDNAAAVVNNPAKGYGHQSHLVAQEFIYHESFWLWTLDYTAGADLDVLGPRLAEVVDEFVQWNEVNKPYRQRLKEEFPERDVDLTICAVDFDNQIWYEDALQLVSVALMLRDARSVRRIIQAMDSNRGVDAVYEQLILDYVEKPWPVEEALHDEPYPTLLKVFEAPDSVDVLPFVQTYLKNWYKAQDGTRWYNGHQKIRNDLAPYYGYWAFEAGAACYLLDIDDSTIDHMVYPKDLVAYGRKLREEGRWTSSLDEPLDSSQADRLRCQAGQPCPREGFWFTPAQIGSRRFFKMGEVMPEVTGTYGLTIWQWDEVSQAPQSES